MPSVYPVLTCDVRCLGGVGVTLLVAADFDTVDGQKLAFDALRRQLHDKKARVGLLSNANSTAPGPVATVLTGILSAVAAHPGAWCVSHVHGA